LQLLGAEVIKVESTTRPDGARSGDVAFYELLNQSKRSVAIDFGTQQGLQDLKMLLSSADIIIESSRPRALLQLGIDPRKVVKNRRGVTWIQLTAHGSDMPESHRIGYGDDAAAAAGLCAQLHRITGQYGFVGDAIADPLTGLYAALSAWRSWVNGGGEMIGLSLRQVTSFCIQRELAEHRFQFEHQLGAWQQLMASLNSHFDAACALNSEEQPSYFSDRTRICEGRVAAFGEDTTKMLKEARALSS
jgi:crotonobetainyl-CoA:carnitine CoA-transferase CaiB-like acyl-CoA transferase